MNSLRPIIPPELLGHAMDKCPWLCGVFSQKTDILTHWNQAFARWFDSKTRLVPANLRIQDFLTVSANDEFRNKILVHARVFGAWEGKLSLRDMWGSESAIYATLTCFCSADGEAMYAMIGSALNEATKAKDSVGISDRDLLHALLETLPMSIYFKDHQGRFIRTSSFKAKKHGFIDTNAIVGLTDFDLFTIDHAQPAFEAEQRIIASGVPEMDREEMETYATGYVTWASSSKFPLLNRDGAIVGTYGISRDITEQKSLETERRELEMQMALSQKLESIGRLASGVAHEINTPAQFISDNTQFLKKAFSTLLPIISTYREMLKTLTDGGAHSDIIQEIQSLEKKSRLDYLLGEIPQTLDDSIEGLGRVRNIVKSLKEFSHPSKSAKGVVNLNRCIETTVAVSRHEWRFVAEIDLQLSPDLPSIMGNFDEINQVILNLVVNAAHAIDEARSKRNETKLGHITIKTAALPEKLVEVRISDDGQGIPEEIRNRIFDPFFTTKEVGKGTGQGLAICRSVVTKMHGGTLNFESEVGKGTTFIIQLPQGVTSEA